MRELILSERQITDEVTDNLQLSHGSAYAVIYNKLGFHNKMDTETTHRRKQTEKHG